MHLFAKWVGVVAMTFAPASLVDRMGTFPTIMGSHVERSIGSHTMPVANGLAPEPGMFITIGRDHVDVFDRRVIDLQGGGPLDPTKAPECASGCPAAFYDPIQFEWLRLVVESATLSTEVPTWVHLAAERDIPAPTLISLAYAAAEARPTTPPYLTLVVNSPGRGLRAQPFFLLPPAGLTLQQGSAALGLTVRFQDGGSFRISGADPTLDTSRTVAGRAQLRSLLVATKKRHPGKETLILVPAPSTTVGELVEVMLVARETFGRVVLSAGQDVLI